MVYEGVSMRVYEINTDNKGEQGAAADAEGRRR